MDSDNDLRHHCLDDMARLLTCQVVFKPLKWRVVMWQVVAIRCRPLWMGLVTRRCHVVVVIGVVEQLQEVMVEEAEVVDDGG